MCSNKRHFSTLQELETTLKKDEVQNRTFDIAKDMEFVEIDPGRSHSDNQERFTALSAVSYRTPGKSFN